MPLLPPTVLQLPSSSTTASALPRPPPMEVSVHACPTYMFSEVQRVFPQPLERERLLILPVILRSTNDLVGMGPAVEAEKDALLEIFMSWASRVCELLGERGHWADMTDPCSGYPVYGERGASCYPDVLANELLLKYPVINTGCCKIMSHPKWHTRIYPATVFSTAPLAELLRCIEIASGTALPVTAAEESPQTDEQQEQAGENTNNACSGNVEATLCTNPTGTPDSSTGIYVAAPSAGLSVPQKNSYWPHRPPLAFFL
ncbi:hypothetical protein CAOG_03394 [Capsaspora owczarzaki ATCC 30864]|uniref:Methylmalonic aciduria and homocystinuria type D protein n=1 Tax=Capsaspora owczarzaki (strain ATCC 30864) TaxID=595528 RepID=A0A0D2VPJ8_CAPO3|nr:hypothetical protein CAOG_03394 [Capsaspora owczarzaki ATCC 30864]KJE92417.1 hypothetical protein CAOG_003394 [Capsaspora owczarzaki ATCC 30864]|eukprot:XP_004364233.1 hypothetical protein CAOG_03394 [Capsaspora owczarzaki ATCC 30864]